MLALVVKVAAMICLPLVVFLVGSRFVVKLSNQDHVVQMLNQLPNPEDRTLLNERFAGYDAAAVARH